MPIISSFMYCDQFNVRNGQAQINEPLNLINPGYLPGKYSFSVVFGMVGIDTEKNQYVKLRFEDEKGNVLIETSELEIGKEKGQAKLPKEYRGVMMSLDFRNIDLKEEGIHKTIITINDDVIGEFPIPVKGSGEHD